MAFMKPTFHRILFFGVSLVFGCRENPPGPQQAVAPPFTLKAVYILNEGNFGDPTGARLSLYDVDRDTAYANVYEAANNNAHLGSVGDDMRIVDGKVYILMSGSENLNVIGLDNHVLLQTANFPGATPHDLLLDVAGDRAFITMLYSRSILVLNLASLAIIDSIRVGENPQGLALAGNNLFVCNSGYGLSKTLSIIDVQADTVTKTVMLADGPTTAALAPNGKLWVACTGNAFGTPATRGKVFIVNTSTFVVEDSITFTENLWGSIVMGGDGYAYVLGVAPGSFYGGPLHRISLATRSVALRFVDGVFYGLAVDDFSGDLYLTDAKNFSTNGEVLIYMNNGILKKRIAAQRGPSVIAFKR